MLSTGRENQAPEYREWRVAPRGLTQGWMGWMDRGGDERWIKRGVEGARDFLPHFFIFKLMQMKAKPHESVLVFLFFHPPVCKRTIHCPPLSEHHAASHKRKKNSQSQDFAAPSKCAFC